MPTYVYECAKCGDEFEVYQSFTDDPLKKHPGCGGKVAKVFQPVGIVLKGSGFYKNDSRNGGNKRAKGGDSSKSDKGEKSEKSDEVGEPEGRFRVQGLGRLGGGRLDVVDARATPSPRRRPATST